MNDTIDTSLFSLLELKRPHHSHRMRTFRPNGRSGVRRLADGRAEDLGPGARQTGAHADGTQVWDTLHGLSSLRRATGVRKFGHGDQIVGYKEERLHFHVQGAQPDRQQLEIQSRRAVDRQRWRGRNGQGICF